MTYWLVKSEPESFSLEDFKKEKVTVWYGVRNYTARNNLRAMQVDDICIFYRSVTKPAAIALARVAVARLLQLAKFFGDTDQAARRESDQQDDKKAHPELPVLAQVDAADLRQVLENMQQVLEGKCADDRAGDIAHATEHHHHDRMCAHLKAHQLGVDVAGLRAPEIARQPSQRARQRERR